MISATSSSTQRWRRISARAGWILFGGALASGAHLASLPMGAPPSDAQAQERIIAQQAPVPMVQGLPDIATVFEQQKPKVVAVRTELAGAQPMLGASPSRVGQGSGLIVDAGGFILTNNHVVAGANRIEVSLATGAKYPARLVGSDQNTDIALLKINAPDPLPAVTFGSSETARVGEWVVAIGSPFGLEYSVTAGILSAKGRNLGQGLYDDFLQTDASINPGNSGGPLFNLRGEVIGVNTAIIRDGQGIGFAVPIDLIKSILPQLKERGYVVRGYLGAGIQALPLEVAQRLKLTPGDGVLLGSIAQGGPAAKAGLRAGDILLVFNGRKLRSVQELLFAVADTPPGETVAVEYWREGKRISATLAITERPDTQRPETEVTAVPKNPSEGPPARLGVEVRDVDAALARELGLPEAHGAYIASVQQGALAAGALRKGDVVLQVDRFKIRSTQELVEAVSRAKAGQAMRMMVWRDKRSIFVAVKR